MRRSALNLAVATLLIHLLLILPGSPSGGAQTLLRFPPELPVLLAVLCLGGAAVRVLVAAVIFVLTLQKLADLAMHSALARSFNPVTDLPLIDASVRLIAGSFGAVVAVAAVLLALVAAIALAGAVWWAAGVWSARRWRRRGRMTVAGLAALAIALALIGPLTPANSLYATQRLDLARSSVADLRDLRRAAAADPFADRIGLLDAIDRDVLLIFIESYGRASFETPLYADTHLGTLRSAQARIAAAGLSARSGFLKAPTQGGQSWLSHSTLASGLWIDDQTRYRAVLASGRQTLFHHARRAGFDTLAVMPAITRPWPEAQMMGFDRILAAADLDYRGKPFNWVTMPDQFTLSVVERLLENHPGAHPDGHPGAAAGRMLDRGRMMMQVALISSHAPWVPVPQMLPWDRLGDGTVFDAMALAGDPPEVVWKDRDRVRLQYREAIDYSLRAVFDFAARRGKDAPLMLILGDHQAAPGIALGDGKDVALHVIGPQELVRRVEGWGFAPGLIPPQAGPALPMDRLRDLILRDFSRVEAPA
ncbi:sulfatase [Paracoccus salsus]|uniref:sulfatase n=1 Tax=Paracoccus salsus TaxID=2911061 RepID=UPI001F37CFB3|nr:sulfatase [Paracoccus salsus]MCF3972775.1 sulfatase [Paracoccus salsus]